MQPPNHNLTTDVYASEYFSYFPTTQNPNPHHQLQLQYTSGVVPDPTPPGVDSYYTISHADGGFTYSHTSIPPVPDYAAPQHWLAEDPTVQQYVDTGSLYVSGATVPQDASQQLIPAMPTYSTWTNPNPTAQPRGTWKKIPKKTKIVQSAWCELCKTECITNDVLYKHRMGRKHLKNLERLKRATSVASTSATTAVNPATTPVNPVGPSNPIIGPSEKPKKGNLGIKKKAETPEDLEKKRRKVLEGGAAANAVRTCQICNVVCNSDTVFRFHLAGQKHASMLKNHSKLV